MKGFKVPNSILKSRLKHSQLLVYLFLLSRQKNNEIDFTFAQIAKALNISPKSVHNGVDKLIGMGLVTKENKKRDSRIVATLFKLTSMPCDSWVWVESKLFELNPNNRVKVYPLF